jgi:hypothetical protein
MTATASVAEPPKVPAPVSKPANISAPVVLASADQVRSPAPASEATPPAPVKHRAARVTTCRCGDQIAEQPEQ